jgi:hypothetical protein
MNGFNMTGRFLALTFLLSGSFLPVVSGAVDASEVSLPAGTILRWDSTTRIKLSRLRSGDELLASLPRPAYARDLRALGEGTRVRLVVDRVERMKADREKRGGWFSVLSRPFARLVPRRRYAVLLRSAEVILADGTTVPARLSLVEVRDGGRISAHSRSRESPASGVADRGTDYRSAGGAASGRGSVLILRLDEPVTLPGDVVQAENAAVSPQPETRARLLLLQPLSGRRNRAGDVFQARLLEPMWLGNRRLVPEGSTIQGRILLQKPPRRWRRAGQMRLGFGKLNLPEGQAAEVSASLVGVEALVNSRLTLDEEGTLRARAATKKRAAIDLGLAYVVGKVVDDVFEESVKAGVSAAAAGTVTSVARYVGIGTGLIFFFAQKGRDVVLPEYTELEIVMTRSEVRADTFGERPPPSAD